jgi:DASH complex subunit DAD3
MDQTQAGGLLDPPELTPLEQEVLDEYERLADNMNKVRLSHSSWNRQSLTLFSARHCPRTSCFESQYRNP